MSALMQSVLIISCFICNVSLLCTGLYSKCPCYVVLYIQSVLSALYAQLRSTSQAEGNHGVQESAELWCDVWCKTRILKQF